MMSAPLFPLMLKLEGRLVVVVGGGQVATRKVEALLRCGAEVRVIAPDVTDRLLQLSTEGRLALDCRRYERSDVTGAALVFAATDRSDVNDAVAADARAASILVNAVDGSGDFDLPAVVRSGAVEAFVSTGGASPALARLVRTQVDALIGPEFDLLAQILRVLRGAARAGVKEDDARRRLYEAVASEEVLAAIRRGERDHLRAQVAAACEASGMAIPREVDDLIESAR